jgi:hypothetical protein
MPNAGEKKVSPNGICTCPPSASAANRRRASASSRALSVSANPWKPGLPVQLPSEAITWVSPTRKLQCMTFSAAPGGLCSGLGLSL